MDFFSIVWNVGIESRWVFRLFYRHRLFFSLPSSLILFIPSHHSSVPLRWCWCACHLGRSRGNKCPIQGTELHQIRVIFNFKISIFPLGQRQNWAAETCTEDTEDTVVELEGKRKGIVKKVPPLLKLQNNLYIYCRVYCIAHSGRYGGMARRGVVVALVHRKHLFVEFSLTPAQFALQRV